MLPCTRIMLPSWRKWADTGVQTQPEIPQASSANFRLRGRNLHLQMCPLGVSGLTCGAQRAGNLPRQLCCIQAERIELFTGATVQGTQVDNSRQRREWLGTAASAFSGLAKAA